MGKDKVATPIVDKNGKQTTVHKNAETIPNLRLNSLPTVPLVATHPDRIKAWNIVLSQDLDPHAISPSSIHGDLTNLDSEEINVARRNLDELESYHDDLNYISEIGGQDEYNSQMAEVLDRYLSLNMRSRKTN